MSRRRCWGIALGLGCVLVVLAVVGFGPGRGQPCVELIFLGYTNQAVTTLNRANINITLTNTGRYAVFLATNAGSCRVRLGIGSFQSISNQGSTYGAFPPVLFHTVLNPGETSLVRSDFKKDGTPFRARVSFHAFGRRDGLAHRFMSSTNAVLGKLGRRLYTKREEHYAESQLLTAPIGAGMDLDEALRLPARPPPRPIVPVSK